MPNGLLPAIVIDDKYVQTESLEIMLNLDNMFPAPQFAQMWPVEGSSERERANKLMKLERSLFAAWCNLVFRPSMGGSSKKQFEDSMDEVDRYNLYSNYRSVYYSILNRFDRC